MKRSPFKASRVAMKQGSKTLAPSRQPIPFASKRTQARRPEREKCLEAVKLRSGGRCEAQPLVTHQCAGPMDGHEPKTRARGGDPTDPNQVLYICRAVHDWAHANPAEAHRVGLLVHSWEETA